MEYDTKCIGKEEFEKLLRLKEDLEKQIESYKNQKTMIHFEFINFSKKENEYTKLYFVSLNKEFLINSNSSKIDLEYINKKYPYKHQIREKIILSNSEKSALFLINVKRHHENYYTILVNYPNKSEENNSLEITFFSKDSDNENHFLCIEDNKIENKEKFIKTKRYNIVNISQESSIILYNNYSGNKLDDNKWNEIFKNHNLIYNFIQGQNKRIGKIFEMREEKEIPNFTEKEKEMIKKVNELVSDGFYNPNLENDYMYLRKEYIYNEENSKEEKNYLDDLNKKFKNIPFFLKYYDNEPTDEDIENIRGLAILNILKELNHESWKETVKDYLEETKLIFDKNNFLTKKDKLMILINYTTAIKPYKTSPRFNYTFTSFYDLIETSSFIKSELLFREIISNLTEESALFFMYLQLDSGSDLDMTTDNTYYMVNHISLIEIKLHLLKEYFYPYFFVYNGNTELIAWNDAQTQIKNYNITNTIFNRVELYEKKPIKNNVVKLALTKFHENCHTKFKGNYNLLFSPRYLINRNLDYIDNKKIDVVCEGENEDLNDYIGESGDALEQYLIGDSTTLSKIIYSTGKDLSELLRLELFIKEDFSELNEIIKNLKLNEDDNIDKNGRQIQQSKKGIYTIPKIKIKKTGRSKMIYYYDLNVASSHFLG